MENHKYILIILLAFINVLNLQAQNIKITGVVSDKKEGFSLPGAHVAVGTIGTVTDNEGRYELSIPAGVHILQVSFTGYKPLSYRLNLQRDTFFNIQLTPDLQLLDQVVVTSGKHEQRLGEVTVSMEVLKPDFIENYAPKSVDEVIERVPGVTIIDGQPNIRGGSGYSYGAGSRVQILLNGIPILTGDAGFPAWSFFPLEVLEQVEIIKGASSALYGSAALNGIINLRTKTPTNEPLTLVKFYSGIYDKPGNNITDELDHIDLHIENGDTISVDSVFKEKAWWNGNNPFFSGASIYHLRKIGSLELMAGADLYAEDSYLQEDYTRRGKLSWSTTYRKQKNKSWLILGLDGNIMLSNSASFFLWGGDGSLSYTPLPNTITNMRSIKINLDPNFTYIDRKNNKHKFQGRFFKNDNRTDRNQSTLSDLYYADYQFQKQFDSLQLIITTGITGSYTAVAAELYGDTTHTAKNGAVYLQLEKKFFNRLNISIGGRYEAHQINDEESETKPVIRAGINYQAAPYTYIRSSFGQGYRFPTIAEKYIRTNVGIIQVFPNPDLHSETGWSAEIGIKQGIGFNNWRGFADVAFFWNEYQDMMEFSFGGASGQLFGFQSINIGATQIRGVEASISGEGKINDLTIGALIGYTYIDPVYKDFDSSTQFFSSAEYNVLKYRFRHTGNSNVELKYKMISLAFSLIYLSNMEAVDKVFVEFIPGVKSYRTNNTEGETIFNIQGGVSIKTGLSVSIAIKNLFNNEYSLRPGLMEAPRNFSVILAGKF